jgi:uncharacterized protein (DUF849 family)
MSVQNFGPVVLAVAPNGGRRTQADHPAIPLTPAELARTAAECLEAGAAMIHAHVRDAAGQHLLDADAYRDAITAIKAEVGDRLVIQITTEAVGRYRPPEQMAVVRALRPEAASLGWREFVASGDEASEGEFAKFLAWMLAERIAPQVIFYVAEEAKQFFAFAQRHGFDATKIPVLFVLGRYSANQTSSPDDLAPFVAPGQPEFAHWMVCAFGPREAECMAAAARLGGHSRVGFENNFFLPDGALAADNAALIRATARAVQSLGAPLASAAQLRAAWARA